jgi:putative SOS response-associated peptidase YedK
MCGRVFVKSSFSELMGAFASVRRESNMPGLDAGPRFNGAPSLTYPIIVHDKDATDGAFTEARWGLIPSWVKEAKPKVQPANARCETLKTNGMFRGAFKSRRCLVPVEGYFEWKANKGAKIKQPYALAMKSGRPFCIAGIWEPRRIPDLAVEQKTFALITCEPNDLVAAIHDRMPVILHEKDYARWLSPAETDPSDLLVPFPSELMKIWPVSTRVNKAGTEGADLLDPVDIEEGREPPGTLL